ncbi:hypothetical protein [Microcoleus sp. bin38.metabat.b11b12b14.051]|uniref:hypothetical protein n=1 Tax=Microcoleus sp. bin38.metabat.b11b12b14.051 TaxID=2742709 RepID=UPI0025CFC8F8|nr:hypothetical protein [Microcoleus sp. bin38.metabat.b11b12b14.051]
MVIGNWLVSALVDRKRLLNKFRCFCQEAINLPVRSLQNLAIGNQKQPGMAIAITLKNYFTDAQV